MEPSLTEPPQEPQTINDHKPFLGNHLTTTCTRRKAPTDVAYDLQVSSDVAGGWTAAGISEQVLPDDGGLQTVRATDPGVVSPDIS